ncbi:MAG: TonB-dependent receptor [Chitinophagales bacterium]
MQKIMATLLCLCCGMQLLFAQEQFTISGYLRDAATGEELLYANVSVDGTTNGVTTNLYGFYSLTLPKGNYTINYTYIGYVMQALEITLDSDISQNVELATNSQKLDEVIVTGEREDENITNTEMSVLSLDIKEIKKLPVLFGEQDILKTIQLLPGVSASSEGGSGFFVRGGDADQNLILLDEAPVYNASHLLGFFSVFNSDALKDVKLYKGGIPSQYGGRASSVMDVRMKNGNMKEWEVMGGIGLISSRLSVEGPFVKDKGSISVSARRTYADIVAGAVNEDFRETSLYFYDLNAKANYKISDKDRIYASAYLGRDVLGVDAFGFDWGNKTFTLRWNHMFSSKIFANTSLVYSDYDYGFNIDAAGFAIDLDAGIYDYNLKQDYTFFLNPKNKIEFGWNTIYHKFKPVVFKFDDTIIDPAQEQQALESGVYVANTQKVNDKLSLYYGLRLSAINNIGEYTDKTYDENNEVLTETYHEKGSFYNTYFNVEPRINATYILNGSSSFKASYNRNVQYLQLLSNSTSGTPTDMWIPSSTYVKPTLADQVALGYFRNFKSNAYKFSVEGYYTNMQNVVDYEDGAETFGNPDIEAELVFGKGRAYGLEFLLEKQKGKFTGWASYTLSKTERKFDEISNGEWFSARQDRTHDISLVAMYQLTRKISLTSSWVYYTGDAVTFPAGKYYIDGDLVNLYTKRNGSRMPDYHRLDLGLTWTLRDTDRFYNDLNFSVYNLYSRKNAYTITFDESESGQTQATRLALFGAVPSITWNFKF